MEVRFSIPYTQYVVVKDDRVVDSDFVKIDTLVNIANVALAYGEIVEKYKNPETGSLERFTVRIQEGKEERFLKEIRTLRGKKPIGKVGYILGLHSAIFLSKDAATKEYHKNEWGYSAIVEGEYIRTGAYMMCTISNQVVEEWKDPVRFEDYIFMAQHGKDPGRIPEETFNELIDDLSKFQNTPNIFLTPKGRDRLARRYMGIAVGLMVRWGFKKDIETLVSLAISRHFEDNIPHPLYTALMDAVNLAKKLGDL
jgi:hypothetical protein